MNQSARGDNCARKERKLTDTVVVMDELASLRSVFVRRTHLHMSKAYRLNHVIQRTNVTCTVLRKKVTWAVRLS